MRRVSGSIATAALVFAAAFATPAMAANFWEKNFYLSGPRYDGALPACDAGLGAIAARFAEKERRYWQSALTIVGFERVKELAYRPWAPNTIPRRFCAALAHVSDGLTRPVFYAIGEDTGMIGQSWGVEWCVVGLDRNLAFNPGCKQARP